MIAFSILDICPIPEGGSVIEAFRNSLDLAQQAENLGYRRFWLAEHHNIPGIASSATPILLAHLAGGTRKIRIGSGGVVLPNHSPLLVAEQFGTLATLFPGRIDLGLGRGSNTDESLARALGRSMRISVSHFAEDLVQLRDYFRPPQPGQLVRAVPTEGVKVPIWLLASSTGGALLAAQLGLPLAFASHFAPAELHEALHVYRTQFKPSEELECPYIMLALTAVAADTDLEAQRLFTSVQRAFLNFFRRMPGKVPAPVKDIKGYCSASEKTALDRALSCAIIGSAESIMHGLQEFIAGTKPDELIVSANLYSHSARVQSFAIIAEVQRRLNQKLCPPQADTHLEEIDSEPRQISEGTK